MLAPRDILFCSLLLIFQCALEFSAASPILSSRENNYHLKCTNAPTVVAGNFLDPKDAIPPTKTPATCQYQYKYLYCTPNTTTYIFFGPIPASPKPQYPTTLHAVTTFVTNTIHSSPSGPNTPLPNGVQYFLTAGSPIQIYAENAPTHNLTYGVLEAALMGLDAWMGAQANGYSDATFQINEGDEWVGSGYMGSLNARGECVFTGSLHPNHFCSATDEGGYIYGFDGGRFCDA